MLHKKFPQRRRFNRGLAHELNHMMNFVSIGLELLPRKAERCVQSH